MSDPRAPFLEKPTVTATVEAEGFDPVVIEFQPLGQVAIMAALGGSPSLVLLSEVAALEQAGEDIPEDIRERVEAISEDQITRETDHRATVALQCHLVSWDLPLPVTPENIRRLDPDLRGAMATAIFGEYHRRKNSCGGPASCASAPTSSNDPAKSVEAGGSETTELPSLDSGKCRCENVLRTAESARSPSGDCPCSPGTSGT